MRGFLGLISDIAMVLAFVIIGRSSHHAAGGFPGLVSTAWPFLSGLAAGEIAVRAWRRPAALWPTGVVVWLSTVAVGMTLRVIAGQGTVPAFIGVALAFLGLFLLGWRACALILARAAKGSGKAGHVSSP
ncbi:MAG TPA: DUF3054 domain-containing protein [Streptosporangiaceae bacterium]|nr:DUF3054 domain-containing protein [Streptosporangiaceae bacterium]